MHMEGLFRKLSSIIRQIGQQKFRAFSRMAYECKFCCINLLSLRTSMKEFIGIYICKATRSIGEIRCLRIYLILGERDLGRVDKKCFTLLFYD